MTRNRHLLVLGATGAIGGAVVEAALREGRAVVAVARDEAALAALRERHAGQALVAIAASVGSDADAASLRRRLQEAGVELEGVVAAICGHGSRGRVLDQPAEFLRRRIDEDLLPHLFAARHLLPLLDGRAGGYVLIGGPGAEQPWAGYGHRSIGAAALRMLARVLHDEARTLGVRVQLLAIDSPARTQANARHACTAWPGADAIARRALGLLDGRGSGVPPRPIVGYAAQPLGYDLWSDDLDHAGVPARAPAPRAGAATTGARTRTRRGPAASTLSAGRTHAVALAGRAEPQSQPGSLPPMNTRTSATRPSPAFPSAVRSGAPLPRAYRSPLAVLTLAALITLAVSACGNSEAAPGAGMPPPPEVSVATVLTKPVHQWDSFNGRVAAVETVELRPRVSGYVQRVAFKEGQEVKKGDLLFVIDSRPYRAALEQAQAQLARAHSEARLAQAQDARAQALIEAKAISREEFETRKAASAQGDAGVRAAEAAVAAARLDLQFTQVRAPIDGRIGRAMATEGNLAQADATLLTTLVSQDPMYVYFEADEQTYLRYAELARKGERERSQNPVRVGLADDAGFPHEGTVDFVDNQVDPATGTIRARAVLPNPDRMLTPGLFARVQVEGSGEFKAMLVDDKAVLTDQDRKYVYVLGPDNKALRKDVTLGRVVDGLRVVESGLAATDKVIVHGVQKVFMPGMPVAPKTIAMGAPAPSPQVAMK